MGASEETQAGWEEAMGKAALDKRQPQESSMHKVGPLRV